MTGRSPSQKLADVWYDLIPETPIGQLWVAGAACGLVAVSFGGPEADFQAAVKKLSGTDPARDPARVASPVAQIRQYLDGERRSFELPICWQVMTRFQQEVLRLVHFIPYGELRTYKAIAVTLGNEKGMRAVGRANATNPIPLVIPCHRVVGVDGSLRGFGGGLETKAWLLRMEGSQLL